MSYAKDKDIRLSGFKQFDGDIQIIFDLVDDVDEIATDFPLIRESFNQRRKKSDHNFIR